jgi:ATP-dependent Zn protease
MIAQQKRAPRRSTAYHEAGHAVIGRVLGMSCGEATIIPNEQENEAGHAITADPFRILEDWWETRGKYRGNTMHSIMLGRVLTYMAGAEAERVILGRCRGGDARDRHDIMSMVYSSESSFSVDTWERVEPRLRAHARILVRRHRDKIERVAKALLKHGTLKAHEIDAILGS